MKLLRLAKFKIHSIAKAIELFYAEAVAVTYKQAISKDQ